jgi:hypothetical protein
MAASSLRAFRRDFLPEAVAEQGDLDKSRAFNILLPGLTIYQLSFLAFEARKSRTQWLIDAIAKAAKEKGIKNPKVRGKTRKPTRVSPERS